MPHSWQLPTCSEPTTSSNLLKRDFEGQHQVAESVFFVIVAQKQQCLLVKWPRSILPLTCHHSNTTWVTPATPQGHTHARVILTPQTLQWFPSVTQSCIQQLPFCWSWTFCISPLLLFRWTRRQHSSWVLLVFTTDVHYFLMFIGNRDYFCEIAYFRV